MVTYCLGNIGAKRRKFRASADETTVSIDNDEVVADFLLDGKVYFVIGATPCANMTVAEYIGYSRALKTRLPENHKSIRARLRKAGSRVGLHTPMRRLSRLEYRKVQLAAKLEDDVRAVYVNLDGIAFSAVTCARIRKMIKRWGKRWNVHAAVSDGRFVPRRAESEVYLPDGCVKGVVPQRGKRISRLRLKGTLNRRGMVFCYKSVKSVVLCDN